MTTPCRERIVAAVQAALAGITGIDGLAVERDRTLPVEEGELPRLVVYEGEEALASGFSGEDLWELQLDVEGYADGADIAAAAAALATLRAKVDQALRADPTLGGLARDLRPAEEPAPQRLDFASATPGKGFVRSFVAVYATEEGDPFAFA